MGFADAFFEEHWRQPRAKEIGDALGLAWNTVVIHKRNLRKKGIDVFCGIRGRIPAGREPRGHATFFAKATRPDDGDLRSSMEVVFATMPADRVKALKMRFGFYTGGAMTLEEVGKKMGVTRERARQLEVDGLRIMRSKSRKEMLGLV